MDSNTFYLNQEEPNRSCFLALREIILNQDNLISETTKYGMPCFCYKINIFCYLWTDKKTKEPYIIMIEGNYLNHPQLEQGSRARMKILRVNPNQDIPIESIKSILNSALELYQNGTVKLK